MIFKFKSLRYLLIYPAIIYSCILEASIIRVSKSLNTKSVTSAIRNANSRDTILVSSGNYFEKNIIIDKPLTLIGENYPVLDGEHTYELISIKSDHVIVKGFKFQHSGMGTLDDVAGIKIYDSENVTIENNIFDDTFFGIYVQFGKNCIIKNNRITAYSTEEQQIGNGIHCWKSDSLQIIGNKITGHRDGIYFEFVTNSIIWRNISQRNIRYGLHFMFSHDDAYISNIFSRNGAGVAVMFTHGVKMFNNTFSDNWGDAAYGLLLKEISGSYINGNRFEQNTSGIYMEGVNRTQVIKNVFSGNGFAIKIQASCMDITLNFNNFFGNTFDIGTNGSLVLNSFNYNYWDHYEGYDIDHDKIGDLPYRPISMYSMIIEKNPPAMVLFRSIIVSLLDKTEKIIPSLTPENLKDNYPLMKALDI
ncbi:MAG TPA: nitrous oxide reductase family maturation protein NosD [Chitinophagales bacterium]|nr:nitrous oxide reductase family maturation protein NosD [Chitinophagales bacterium]